MTATTCYTKTCQVCENVITHLIDELYYCVVCDTVLYDGGEICQQQK